jgi:hypothetical protein
MKKEESLQLAVCNYLRYQYPDVIFTCDLSSGMKLSIGQAVKAQKMRSSKGMPDLMIFEPRGDRHGLFIELKTVSPYLKNGDIKTNQHLIQQDEIRKRLFSKGYHSTFGVGFDQCKSIIDYYLKTK